MKNKWLLLSIPVLAIAPVAGVAASMIPNNNVVEINKSNSFINTKADTSINLPATIDANENEGVFYKIFVNNSGFKIDWEQNVYNLTDMQNALMKYINDNNLFNNPSTDTNNPTHVTAVVITPNYAMNNFSAAITIKNAIVGSQTQPTATQEIVFILKDIPTQKSTDLAKSNIFNYVFNDLSTHVNALTQAPSATDIQNVVQESLNKHKNLLPQVVVNANATVSIAPIAQESLNIDQANKTVTIPANTIVINTPANLSINFAWNEEISLNWNKQTTPPPTTTPNNESNWTNNVILIAAVVPSAVVLVAALITCIFLGAKAYRDRVWKGDR